MSIESCGIAVGENEAHISAKAWALDMDRMLADSTACMTSVKEIVPKFGIDAHVIAKAQSATEADGGTFSPLGFIEDELTPKQFSDFGEAFMHDRTSVVYEDTLPFLDTIHEAAEPFVIPTYGVRTLFQFIKAFRIGRPVYVESMPHTRKPLQMAGWLGREDTYDFRGLDKDGNDTGAYHAPVIILVDDKEASHADLNVAPQAYGFVLKRPGKRLPSQNTGLPEHVRDRVTEVTNLREEIPDALAALALDSTWEASRCNGLRTNHRGPLGAIERYARTRIINSTVNPKPKTLAKTVAFRPVYSRGNYYPGMFINPKKTTFAELQEAAARHDDFIARQKTEGTVR